MTKEEWISISSQLEMPISIFFEYYKEKGGQVTDPLTFERIFVQLCLENRVWLKAGKQTQMNYKTCLSRVYDYYNQKFDIG